MLAPAKPQVTTALRHYYLLISGFGVQVPDGAQTLSDLGGLLWIRIMNAHWRVYAATAMPRIRRALTWADCSSQPPPGVASTALRYHLIRPTSARA